MGKTFSCTFEGCGQVFSRGFQLKKHKATHDDPDSLHHCQYCDFFTLDPRNLAVHTAKHTGVKSYGCPDTIKVCQPSGSLVEEGCQYRTNDRSLLTKHRRKVHKYIPRRRASPQRGTGITFAIPPPAATENHATTTKSKGASGSTPVAADQDICAGASFNPARDDHWSGFDTEDFAGSSTLSNNSDNYTMDDFEMMTGHSEPDAMGWDASVWDAFWDSLRYT